MAFNGGLASILVKAYCHSMFKMVPDIVDVQLSKLSVYASGDISLSSPVILLQLRRQTLKNAVNMIAVNSYWKNGSMSGNLCTMTSRAAANE